MAIDRRQLLLSLGAGLATAAACRNSTPPDATAGKPQPLRSAAGEVDWTAVRDLFPLSRDWTHLAGFLALPAMMGVHRDIGRDNIANRIHELNAAFREGAASIKGLPLHTPLGRDVSAGLSAFEIAGVKPEQVTERLRAKKIRTSHSPYKVSYARVSAGIMNSQADIDTVLRELRAIAGGSL